MLVKDLIAKLQQYDEYTEVYANYDYDFLALQEINPHVEKIDHK